MKRLKKKMSYYLIGLLLIILTAIVVSISPREDRIMVHFGSCVDGDTAKFILDGKVISVRFLAIDTPESVHPAIEEEEYGREASIYTCDELTNAHIITLEFDNNSDQYDKYNRLLAWVFVDNILLQSKLIDKGYAKVYYLYDDYKYSNYLLEKEAIAKANNLGIWYNE
jgi:micrococcal nuclease